MKDVNTYQYFSLCRPLARLRSHFAWKAREAMLESFLTKFSIGPEAKVLDIGVTPDVTLPESNHFEQRFPYPSNLTATSIEDIDGLKEKFPQVRILRTTGSHLPFQDNEFDAVFCSAVIEHVGTRQQQEAFLREVARVGKGFMITTPNRWFPLDFHTALPLLHWLPQFAHQAILKLLGQHFWAQTSNLNLLSKSDLMALKPKNASLDVQEIKLFGWTSNLIAYGRNQTD